MFKPGQEVMIVAGALAGVGQLVTVHQAMVCEQAGQVSAIYTVLPAQYRWGQQVLFQQQHLAAVDTTVVLQDMLA